MKRTRSRFGVIVFAILAIAFIRAVPSAYAVTFLAVGAGDATTDGATPLDPCRPGR